MIDVNFGQKAKGIEGSYILLSSGGGTLFGGSLLVGLESQLVQIHKTYR